MKNYIIFCKLIPITFLKNYVEFLLANRYALSRIIHRIQSEIIFHVNPNLYMEWLGLENLWGRGPNGTFCTKIIKQAKNLFLQM